MIPLNEDNNLINKYFVKMRSTDKEKCYLSSSNLANKLLDNKYPKDKIFLLGFGKDKILMHSAVYCEIDKTIYDFEKYKWSQDMYSNYIFCAISLYNLLGNRVINDEKVVKEIMEDKYKKIIVLGNIKEAENIGLVSSKNLNDLLTDDILHSYFSDTENFDAFYADITEFFKTEILTVNKLKEYLDNLGYGPKTVDLSIEILSKSDEDRSKERQINK